MLKKTKQKKAILEVLAGTRSHPDAGWIYRQVRIKIPNISLGTVYRNLRLMRDNGEILEVYCGGNPGRFDAETRNHYHFKCNICGNIIDIDIPVDHKLDHEMNRKTGLDIRYHRTDFYGLCDSCKNAEKPVVQKKRGKRDGKSSNIS